MKPGREREIGMEKQKGINRTGESEEKRGKNYKDTITIRVASLISSSEERERERERTEPRAAY